MTRAEGLARKTEKQKLAQLLYLQPLAPLTWSGGVRARVCPVAPLLAQHEGVPCLLQHTAFAWWASLWEQCLLGWPQAVLGP